MTILGYLFIGVVLAYVAAVSLLASTRRTRVIDFSDVRVEDLQFPEEFLFGAATSAHQVEGGITSNNWTQWENETRPDGSPTIRTGEKVGRAADHWNRFEEDVERMKELGLDVYRFSVEWSRVEPREGEFDDAAMARYRSWCEILRREGIRPMVTLHHFTEPLWLTERGGFENREAVGHFERFAAHVATNLAEHVEYWITVNEPAVYAVQGWLMREFPPGRTDPGAMVRVLENLMLAHAKAYHAIHGIYAKRGGSCSVTFANNVVMFRPHRRYHLLEAAAASLLHRAYNRAVWDAAETGRFRIVLPGTVRTDRHHPELAGTSDFSALNHYFSQIIRFDPKEPLRVSFAFDESEGVNDMGWGLTPQTLYESIRFAARYGKPVIITENGTCDGDLPDLRRRRYLLQCLAAVREAMADGADVRGYLYWSLMDNFEWSCGYDPRFGLFRVDYGTQERTLTGGGELFRTVIARHRERRKDAAAFAPASGRF